MLFLYLKTSHYDDNLAAGSMFGEMGNKFGQTASYALLMYFGNLTGYTGWAVGTEDFSELLQSFHKPVRRLVENHRPRL